jgi:hypothetical protein
LIETKGDSGTGCLSSFETLRNLMKLAYTLVTAVVMTIAVYCGIQDYGRSPAFRRLLAGGDGQTNTRDKPNSRWGDPVSAVTSRTAGDVVNQTKSESPDKPYADRKSRDGDIRSAISEATQLYEEAREIYRRVVTEEASSESLHEARKHLDKAHEIITHLPADSSQVGQLKQKILQVKNAVIKGLPL